MERAKGPYVARRVIDLAPWPIEGRPVFGALRWAALAATRRAQAARRLGACLERLAPRCLVGTVPARGKGLDDHWPAVAAGSSWKGPQADLT